MKKLTAPARWRQLWLEDTPKPNLMRLWFDRHSKHHHALEEYEGDDIEDFEGHNLFDDGDDDDDEKEGVDMAWLFPQKGPGKFKNKKKNKKNGKKNENFFRSRDVLKKDKKGKKKKKSSKKKSKASAKKTDL